MGLLLFWNGVGAGGGADAGGGSTLVTTTVTPGYPPYSSPGTAPRSITIPVRIHKNALTGPIRTKQKRTLK